MVPVRFGHHLNVLVVAITEREQANGLSHREIGHGITDEFRRRPSSY
ncbi:hypothetical protein [Streptomyces sp. ERV7]|nr:hypothetical protein [Streptomyces sp. ERV7]